MRSVVRQKGLGILQSSSPWHCTHRPLVPQIGDLGGQAGDASQGMAAGGGGIIGGDIAGGAGCAGQELIDPTGKRSMDPSA